jgi:hypothetical protein
MIYVGGRWVGMVFRDPDPPVKFVDVWVAYDRGGRPVESREEAIRSVLQHAQAHPEFSLS